MVDQPWNDDYQDDLASLDMFGRPSRREPPPRQLGDAMVDQPGNVDYQDDLASLDMFGRPSRREPPPRQLGDAMVDQPGNVDYQGHRASLDMFGRPSRREPPPRQLRGHVPVEAKAAGTNLDALHPLSEVKDDDEFELFTVSNPQGTVSVSALMGGRIHRVRLSARVTSMTEPELTDEIIVIARLAQQKARSAQHTLMLQSLNNAANAGRRAALHNFVSRTLNLPTPEEAAAAEAKVFATRYVDG